MQCGYAPGNYVCISATILGRFASGAWNYHFIIYIIVFGITNKKLTTWPLENFTGKKIMTSTICSYTHKLPLVRNVFCSSDCKAHLFTQQEPRQMSSWLSHNHNNGGDHLIMVPCVLENLLVKCSAFLI